jgi:very-short-patch-repair endonuclease
MRLWQELRGRRLEGWKFRRQVPIAGFVVDFCCEAARLTIEIDGTHHADQAEADRSRTAAIEAVGYKEIRFTNADVSGRQAWVLEEIRRMLDVARSEAMRQPLPRLDAE